MGRFGAGQFVSDYLDNFDRYKKAFDLIDLLKFFGAFFDYEETKEQEAIREKNDFDPDYAADMIASFLQEYLDKFGVDEFIKLLEHGTEYEVQKTFHDFVLYMLLCYRI